MVSVSELREICEHVEKEYGSDCNIVIQFHNKKDNRQILGIDYALDCGWQEDGTLILSNSKSENKRGM